MANQVIAESAAALARLQIAVIQRFVSNLRDTYETEAKRLGALIDEADRQDYADYLADQHLTEVEVVELGGQLAMVALYRVIELSTKSLLRFRYRGAAASLYKFDVLAARLQSDLSVDLRSVTNFASIDEIRLINNAVKHDGKVSNALSQYPGWTRGDELTGLEQAFDRLAPSVPDYLIALAKVVVP
jgi:hypothetical protein